MLLELILVATSWILLTGQQLGLKINEREFQGQRQRVEEVAEKNIPGVVKIVGHREVKYKFFSRLVPASEGTGFVVSEDGKVLTNKHVVSTGELVYKVTTVDGTEYEARGINKDPNNDIALITIDPDEHKKSLQIIEMGDSEEIESGAAVAALGNDPGRIQPTLLTGRVIGVDDTIVAGRSRFRKVEVLRDLILTDLDLVSGNSGSPLLDNNGKAVGINTATSRDGEISFSIPINEAKDFIQLL